MSKITQVVFAVLVVIAGTSSAFAAPYRMDDSASTRDSWFKPVHLDDASVPAKTYFEQMQQDGN